MEEKSCHTCVPVNMVCITYSNLFIRFNLKMCTTNQPRRELKDVILLRCNLTKLTVLISFQRMCSESTILTIDFGMSGEKSSKCHQSKWSVNVASKLVISCQGVLPQSL